MQHFGIKCCIFFCMSCAFTDLFLIHRKSGRPAVVRLTTMPNFLLYKKLRHMPKIKKSHMPAASVHVRSFLSEK